MTWSSWYTSAGVALLLCFWALGAHNRLMALRAAIHTAWVPLEAVLTERAQALQTLCDALRQRAPEEGPVLDAVAAAVSQVRVAVDQVRPRPSRPDAVTGLVAAEAALEPALARLMALLAPDSPAHDDDALRPTLQMLPALQARLGFGREAYNDAVRRYNDAVHQFPTQLLAPLLRFGRAARL